MVALWILGILGLLIIWLCLTRVGVQIVLADSSATVDIKIGLFHFQVFPGKEKRNKKTSTDHSKKTKEETAKKAMPKFALADIKEAVGVLWPPLKRALNRTRRGVRIHPLSVSLTLGGAKDPAAAAELYGYLHAGVWSGMPVLENALNIPDPCIHIGIDFDMPDLVLEGKIGVTARIGTILVTVLGIAFPALQWFLKTQKKTKQQNTAPQPVA